MFCALPTERMCSRTVGSLWKDPVSSSSRIGDSRLPISDCEQEVNDDLRNAYVPNQDPCYAGLSRRVREHWHQDYQQIRKIDRLLADGVRHTQFDRLYLGVRRLQSSASAT